MMEDFFSRSLPLLKEDGLQRLQSATVAVVGLGGVGGSACEALCRSGIGRLILVDADTISLSNLNRQLFATQQTIGLSKCEAARQRLSSIRPSMTIETLPLFLLPENLDRLFSYQMDYIIDAIDTMTTKLALAKQALAVGIPLIASLGTGNRLDPSKLRVGDLSETAGCGCPLARRMRRELKKEAIYHLPVVYSTEKPIQVVISQENNTNRHPPGSLSFVPPVAGYLLASRVVRDIAFGSSHT